MTETEMLALAVELQQRVHLLAELAQHPRTNAAAIALHRAEAVALSEALSGALVTMDLGVTL